MAVFWLVLKKIRWMVVATPGVKYKTPLLSTGKLRSIFTNVFALFFFEKSHCPLFGGEEGRDCACVFLRIFFCFFPSDLY